MASSTQSKITIYSILFGVVLGASVLGVLLYIFGPQATHREEIVSDNTPLYWVAPMDDNYRRDKPGKSPMGMDLVPVYKKTNNSHEGETDGFFIAPDVVNNLGVRTKVAERKPLKNTIVTVGYVQYDEDKLIHIHSRVSGWVEKLYVTSTGNPVKKGEPLYTLYSPELVNAQEEFILALNRNNARFVELAENRLRVLKISDRFIESLKRDRVVKQTVPFFAPQSGVVGMLNIREGFFVEPDLTMLSIGSLDQVWVEAEIFERQTSLVNTGDPVTMTLDYLPGKTWSGHVDYIYPALDSKTRTLRIRLRFDNKHGDLKPNMFAQVVVEPKSSEALLVIPHEALIRTGKHDRVVLALGDGYFKSVEVMAGRFGAKYVEILKGLSEGDRIVTSAQFLLDSESSKTFGVARMHHDIDDASDMDHIESHELGE